LKNFSLVGFSMGGERSRALFGEVRKQWLSKAVFIGGIPPFLLKTADNPEADPSPGSYRRWPIPNSVRRPITGRVWVEEGAKILEPGEVVPGHLATATLIAAPAGGADPKVLAAVIGGAVAPM
jgi:hypothetical protein